MMFSIYVIYYASHSLLTDLTVGHTSHILTYRSHYRIASVRHKKYSHRRHAHISKTCKCCLLVFLNSINNNSHDFDKLSDIIDEINNITLAKFKNVIKGYMMNKYSYYCNIPNCYICQHKLFVSLLYLSRSLCIYSMSIIDMR